MLGSAILFALDMSGVVGNLESSEMDLRAARAESIALRAADAAESHNMVRLRTVLIGAVQQDEELLSAMGARVRLIGPPTLLPPSADRLGAEVFTDMRKGLAGVDIVMMLRLQSERMESNYLPSLREFYHLYGTEVPSIAGEVDPNELNDLVSDPQYAREYGLVTDRLEALLASEP